MIWDERYARGEHVGLAPLEFIARLAERLAPGRALDLACGSGRHANLLAAHGWQVTAVDSSSVALTHLDARVRAVQADLERREFMIEPGAWDLVLDCCYLQRDLVPSILAGVAPGGRVAMAIPLHGAMNPAYTVAPGELRGWFEGWEVEHWQEARLAEIVGRRAQSQ